MRWASGVGCAALLCLVSQPAVAAGLRLEAELSIERDGNPARAEQGEGVPGEFIQSAAFRAAHSFRIDERSGWVLHAEGALRRHDRYHGLDELEFGAGALYRIQPQVGFSAPWFEAGAALGRSQRAGSAIRNLTRANLDLAMGANLTDRIAARAGVRLARAVADSGSVFDQRERALDLEGSYRFGGGSTAFARWSAARGDQVFGAPLEEYGSGIRAEADDPAIGDGYYAYRVGAATKVLEAGISVPSGRRHNWTLWVRGIRSESDAGLVYQTRKAGLGWRYLLD